DLDLVDVSIHDNQADLGGGFGGGIVALSGAVTLDGASEVRGNVARSTGGGVAIYSGSLTRGALSGNRGDQGRGGGRYLQDGDASDVTLDGNRTSATGYVGYGGGVCVLGSATLTNVSATNNQAGYGGGIDATSTSDGPLDLASVTLTGNTA